MIDKFLTYLRAEKRCSDNTLEAYGRDIRQFLGFLGFGQEDGDAKAAGARPAESSGGRSSRAVSAGAGDAASGAFDPAAVTTDDIREWILDMSGRGLSATSINRKTSSLRTLFRYLRKTGEVSADPFRGIGSRKIPARLPGFVPESQMEDILADLEADFLSNNYSVCRNAMVVIVLYTTGVRVSELQGIRIGDFSGRYSELRVRGKGNKERVIPIMAYTRRKIVEFLERIRSLNICISPGLSLFLSEKGEPLSRNEIYKIVHAVLGNEGVQGKRSPHVLRHTFATHMLDGGADIREIQEILGHNSLAATQVYTHNSIAKLKEVYGRAHPRCRETGSKDDDGKR